MGDRVDWTIYVKCHFYKMWFIDIQSYVFTLLSLLGKLFHLQYMIVFVSPNVTSILFYQSLLLIFLALLHTNDFSSFTFNLYVSEGEVYLLQVTYSWFLTFDPICQSASLNQKMKNIYIKCSYWFYINLCNFTVGIILFLYDFHSFIYSTNDCFPSFSLVIVIALYVCV